MRTLPTAAQFTAIQSPGFAFNGNEAVARANLKALGFTGLYAVFGVAEATIEFNTKVQSRLGPEPRCGIGPVDFETVAVHEIGHALGFISIVDRLVYRRWSLGKPLNGQLFNRKSDRHLRSPSVPRFCNADHDLQRAGIGSHRLGCKSCTVVARVLVGDTVLIGLVVLRDIR